MLKITYAPGDAALATRLQNDLSAAAMDDATPILIAILSPEAEHNREVENALNAALDQGQWIVPVIARPTALPHLIDHLPVVDFSSRYDMDGLLAHLNTIQAEAPQARWPMRVRTPAVKSSNRIIGLALFIIAGGVFVLGLLAVGGGAVAFPKDEYDVINTEVAATANAYVSRNLPRSTQDALNFPSTVDAAPRAQRPLLRATATAMAASTEDGN
jgi:hypothetical protein